MSHIDRQFHGSAVKDWRDPENYALLETAERQAFAWEWLRRTHAYRLAWDDHLGSSGAAARSSQVAAPFGLVALENPSQSFDRARPLWRADKDRSVLVADVLDEEPTPGNGINLLAVASLVTLEIDDDDDEHLLLSDGRRSVRIDIKGGTLLGAPAMLSYRMSGVARAKAQVAALRRLVSVILTERLPGPSSCREQRARRWAVELRVADALAAGASHQDIARALFGTLIDEPSWRCGSASVRMRVRRLVRAAQRQLAEGAHFEWLDP
jgi:hypothetical protein